MKLPLPVPEFVEEDDYSFSFKQRRGNHDSHHLRRPPKLHHSLNRSINTSVASIVSFRQDDSRTELSAIYNKNRPEPYYEQCFEQLCKVGEGSFGEVFKVRSREDGCLYAVKKSKTYFRSSQSRQSCFEEVRRYEQFSDHENCVKLYQAWEEDDRLYMQMELCRENLEVYAREQQQQLSEGRIWSILLDLLLALKSLHDRNLIHLDIKLDNILVTDDGTCKLADFGLVFDLSKGNTKNAREGDSRYLAPELMEGRYSKAADIFSLGIAVLELSCNVELPLNGRMWQRLRNGQPLPESLARRMSLPMRDIVVQMMKPNPEDRPTVDALLMHPNIRKIYETRPKQRSSAIRRPSSYFYRKLFSLWRLVATAVMWLAACLRLQHRKMAPQNGLKSAIDYSGIDEHSRKKQTMVGGCGSKDISIGSCTRNGVSFGASRSFQDQASGLLAEEDDLYDDTFALDSSVYSVGGGRDRSRDQSYRTEDTADAIDSEKESLQITPTLNNSIPVHSPTVRIVNSTPLNHHHFQNLHSSSLAQLQNGRKGQRNSSRVLCSPLRLLWVEEDEIPDIVRARSGSSPHVQSCTASPVLRKGSHLNDSDSDFQPLGTPVDDLDASVQETKASSGNLSSSSAHTLSVLNTPSCSLMRSFSSIGTAGNDTSIQSAGCETESHGYSSFLIKKKLCFNEENDDSE